MNPETIKSYFAKQLESSRDAYIRDLEAMSEEDLLNGMGGNERKGIDFSYEVAYVNRRFAMRMREEDPGAWPDGDWMVAPDDQRSKDAAINGIRESMNDLISTWNAIPAEEITRVIVVPTGETSPLDLAFSCCWHNGYHDAQLNYLQQLKGDMAMHWQD